MVKSLIKLNILVRLWIFFIFLASFLFSDRVVGYYPSWVQGDFNVDQIDFSTFTHVNHSFAWPNNQGDIQADNGTFNTSFANHIQSQGSKFLLALGGWGAAESFAASTSTPELRSYFISNIIEKINTYGYDGIDIDWEYPQNNQQRNNLNLFIAELDSSMNDLNSELLLTMAVPISNWAGQWYDFETLNQYIDFFNAMTYDIHGGWSDHVGHNSPLYQSPPGDPDGSCSTGISYLSNTRGIPDSQLNLGLPFWGKKYNSSGINESFSGDVIDKRYYEIPDLIGNGWTYEWDSNAFCPYLVKDDQSKILTFDDQESIRYKCEFAIDQELGGVMIWALGYDVTENGQELIQSIEQNYLSSEVTRQIIADQLLLKAFPNPFNSKCAFQIKLSRDQLVELNIFSVTGQQIFNIPNRPMSSGTHTITWNGRDFLGRSTSGLFFVELIGETTKSITKIIYLK